MVIIKDEENQMGAWRMGGSARLRHDMETTRQWTDDMHGSSDTCRKFDGQSVMKRRGHRKRRPDRV